MRSFSGFYFYLRLSFHILSEIFHIVLNKSGMTSLGVTFFISALIITIIRPYRKSYMNNISLMLFCSQT